MGNNQSIEGFKANHKHQNPEKDRTNPAMRALLAAFLATNVLLRLNLENGQEHCFFDGEAITAGRMLRGHNELKNMIDDYMYLHSITSFEQRMGAEHSPCP
jgi:hypothetical protein